MSDLIDQYKQLAKAADDKAIELIGSFEKGKLTVNELENAFENLAKENQQRVKEYIRKLNSAPEG